jgi:hypothetical protein
LAGHLDEVEVLRGGHVERILDLQDPYLAAVCPYDPDAGDADAIVDPQIRCDASLLPTADTKKAGDAKTDVTG